MVRKKTPYSRARRRARFRKPRQRRSGSVLWGVAIVLVVVIGVGAVAMVRSDRESQAGVPPRVGDHWHAYLGINACGDWLPNWPSFDTVDGSTTIQTGVHSHADGNIHIHPISSSEAGNNATVGRFVDNGGGSVSGDAFVLWDGTQYRDGDTCDTGEFAGETGIVQWTLDGEVQEGNPSDHRLENGEILALYFLPEGAELTEPPGAAQAIANPIDLQPQGVEPGAPAPVGDTPGIEPDGASTPSPGEPVPVP